MPLPFSGRRRKLAAGHPDRERRSGGRRHGIANDRLVVGSPDDSVAALESGTGSENGEGCRRGIEPTSGACDPRGHQLRQCEGEPILPPASLADSRPGGPRRSVEQIARALAARGQSGGGMQSIECPSLAKDLALGPGKQARCRAMHPIGATRQ
jgi:hypothetical protein